MTNAQDGKMEGGLYVALLLLIAAEGTLADGDSVVPKPKRDVWAQMSGIKTKVGYLEWLIDGCATSPHQVLYHCKSTPIQERDYQSFDGFGNSEAFPTRGMAGKNSLYTGAKTGGSKMNQNMVYQYTDRVSKPGMLDAPNPLKLSYELFRHGKITTSKTHNRLLVTGRNQLLHFFGKYVVEELVNTRTMSCPMEFFHIPIPKGVEPWSSSGAEYMPFVRAQHDPGTGTSSQNQRLQVNKVTPWIDASSVYGPSRMWANILRTRHDGEIEKDGMLASDGSGLYPEYNWMRLPFNNQPTCVNHTFYEQVKLGFPTGRLHGFGHVNGNDNPALFAISTVWFRWHNALADYFRAKHPSLSDEVIFQEARRWVIATMQRVIMYEWFNTTFTMPLPPYQGYDFSNDPQMELAVASAALRFGHMHIPKVMNMRLRASFSCIGQPYTVAGAVASKTGIRVCQSYWTGQDTFYHDLMKPSGTASQVEPPYLLMGLANQQARSEGNVMEEDVREYLYGPMSFSRRDLAAIDIQRTRDFGVPDYNSWRKHFNLPVLTKLEEIADTIDGQVVSREILRKADEIYANGKIDLYVGGMLESRGEVPGPLFEAMIRSYFAAVRNGDMYWYENKDNGRFSDEEITRINQVKFSDIMLYVTNMVADDIHEDAFVLPRLDDLRDNHKCKLTFSKSTKTCYREDWSGAGEKCYFIPDANGTDEVEPCSPLKQYSFFAGNEISIAFTALFFVSVLAGLMGTLNFKIASSSQKWSKRAPEMLGLEQMASSVDKKSFTAMEFQGIKRGSRQVIVVLNYHENTIQLWGPLGGELRTVPLSLFKKVYIILGSDGQHLIVKVPFEYDIVLEFVLASHRDNVMTALGSFFSDNNIAYLCQNLKLNAALSQTVTFEDRQAILKRFFSVIILQTQKVYKTTEAVLSAREIRKRYAQVEDVHLNEIEFAEALGMNQNSKFLKKLFRLVAGTKASYISVREFLNFFLTFSRGPALRKVMMMFQMYDTKGAGVLGFPEFKTLLINLAEISMPGINQGDLSSVVDGLMKDAGIYHVNEFKPSDLESLLQVYRNVLGYAHLDLYGPNIPETGGSVAMPFNQRHLSYFDAAMMAASDLTNAPRDVLNDPANTAIVLTTKTKKKSPLGQLLFQIKLEWNKYMLLLIVVLISMAIAGSSFYGYDNTPEQKSLHEFVGVAVVLSKSTGSALLFLYCLQPLTTCRNLNSYLRETFFSSVIPFDSLIEIHKTIAWIANVFGVIHLICSNVHYGLLSSKEPIYVDCLVDYMNLESHQRANFNFWFWGTVTGITGNIMFVLLLIMTAYALDRSRRKAFRWFWISHMAYILFYPILLLHYLGDATEAPPSLGFMLIPLFMYIVDRIALVSQHKVAFDVVEFELLPSNMVKLVVRKPLHFTFKAGQWIRLACTALNSKEYHPLTIASLPLDNRMEFYVQVVGPWTYNLRSVYNLQKIRREKYSKVFIEGPFGSLSQNWGNYEVSIIITNGEKVLSFISVLKEVVFLGNKRLSILCKKVFFIWCTSTQKHFEWIVEILRELESIDHKRILSTHMCITEATDKYDIRTVMLYLCEEQFHKVRDRSLFTGLRMKTHFGKPSFRTFFTSVRNIFKVRSYGVFYSGDHQTKNDITNIINSLNEASNVGKYELITVK